MDDEFQPPRFAPKGRAYMYVLPCRDEDLLKIGYSRDPLQRFHSLHRRFYAFFDLERGLLIETERTAQARRIERRLLTTWVDRRAPAPLVVRAAAAGDTEWYRGIHAEAAALAQQIAQEEALPLHQPLRAWLAATLAPRADALYDWSERMLIAAREEAAYVPPGEAGPVARALLDTLSLCEGVGLALEHRLPASVLDWYRFGPHRSLFVD